MLVWEIIKYDIPTLIVKLSVPQEQYIQQRKCFNPNKLRECRIPIVNYT